jgi:ubiquinone/menaquinone biosynthesis C-methylase UbiE
MTNPSGYPDYDVIEDEFEAALDASQNPRSPELLYELVADLGLPQGAAVIDLGCGKGRDSFELPRRFGFRVLGVDLDERRIEQCNAQLGELGRIEPGLAALTSFTRANASGLPAEDASVDLIWCRDVLEMIEDIDGALAECRRVIKPGGHLLVYTMFATSSLEPIEAALIWDIAPANSDAEGVEAAFARAGFETLECVELTSEWGQYREETTGKGSRKLIHAARLISDPERWVTAYGKENYDTKLADCLWHVYELTGKLAPRVYLLRRC